MAGILSERRKNLLAGRRSRDEMVAGKSNTVRIYLCSAATDFATERDAFMESVHPRLREYCRDTHGLEFQVIDLNWGRPSASLDLDEQADLSSASLREIQKCVELSTGPNFIAFLGQKYGPQALPDSIPQDHFGVLRMALQAHRSRDTRSAPVLDHCYFLDENNIPPGYVLKDRATLVTQLSDSNKEANLSMREKWEELRSELIRLIHKGAELACLSGNMNREAAAPYFLSELENQILLAIELNERPDEGCLLVTRDIQDLKNYTHDPRASSFADIKLDPKTETYRLDDEAGHSLVKLRSRVAGTIPSDNTIHHEVLWRYETVIHPELHKEYLSSLCERLYSTCVRLIDKTAPTPEIDLPRACVEAEQHWGQCRRLAQNIHASGPVLARLQEYVTGPLTTPLIVFGPHGCGKSTVVSKLAVEIQDRLSDDYKLVLRYIGEATKCVDMRQMLTSLCQHVAMATGQPEGTYPWDTKELSGMFIHLVTSVPASIGLVLVLDGLEQLSPSHETVALNWLPLELPSNVKLILTVHDTSLGLLEHIRHELLPDSPQSFLEVSPISVDECEDLLADTLSALSRTLTSGQRRAVREALHGEPTPLFVELLVNIVKDVHSATNAELLSLPLNSEDAITSLFDKLEAKHGQFLVSRTFSYVVASGTGLSYCELEDLLSMDKDVLSEIFQSFDPPVRRVPCLKWLALRQDVNLFLVCREVDGVTVTAWKHVVFNDVVRTRYLCDVSVAARIHSNIANYFLGAGSGRSKLVATPGLNEPSYCSNPERKLPSEPHPHDETPTMLNRRMYQQVPRHLQLAGRHKELDSQVLFNYQWLYNKIKALSLHDVLADFALNPSEEAALVEEVLRLSEAVIQDDIHILPTEISGHLLPYYESHCNIRSLINQCDTVGLKQCAMVPTFPYHHVPGSSLKFTLTCPTEMDHFFLTHEGRHLVTKKMDDTDVHTFDLVSGEHKASVMASVGELYTTPNGKYLIIVDHVTEKAIKIHDAETGAFLKLIVIMNHMEGKSSLYKKGPLCVTNDRLCAVVTLTNSVLCICDIPSGQVLSIVPLDGKAGLCTLTPDGGRVFTNSNDYLLAFDVYTQAHLLTLAMDTKPAALAFTQDGHRAFLSNDTDAKVAFLDLRDNAVDVTLLLAFDDEMPGDCIQDLKVSPDDATLLIRGQKTLVVHDLTLDEVTVLRVPGGVHSKFSSTGLPAFSTEHHFLHAEFCRDNRCVVGATFRDVYVWMVAGGLLVSVFEGHLGPVTFMLVSRSLDCVVTHRGKSKDLQIWNVSEGARKVDCREKLESAISEFRLTSDNSLLFVKCRHSLDLGIIDMRTGCLAHVLAHDAVVQDFAVSPDGKWTLVSTVVRLDGTAFRLWDNHKRRVVLERGDVTGYAVGTHALPCLIMVAQKDNSFRAPYFISILHLTSSGFTEQSCPESFVQTVRSKPLVTSNDEYLIIHSNLDPVSSRETHSQPSLQMFQVTSGARSRTWDASSMNFQEHLQDILEVRPCCQPNGNLVAAIFSCKDRHRVTSATNSDNSGHTFGFFLLDASTGSLTLLCIPFPTPSNGVHTNPLIFTPDCRMCMDELSNIFHIPSEEFIGQVPSSLFPPRAFALQGTVVVYHSRTVLQMTRVSDGALIARCHVSSPICHLLVCADERTVLVGCEDGAVLCYTLIDPTRESASLVLDRITSRSLVRPELTDDRLNQSSMTVYRAGTQDES